jgi:uncharacterized Fe-S radical SAM superfamily protein PflX
VNASTPRAKAWCLPVSKEEKVYRALADCMLGESACRITCVKRSRERCRITEMKNTTVGRAILNLILHGMEYA